jgi:hypothetical protein
MSEVLTINTEQPEIKVVETVEELQNLSTTLKNLHVPQRLEGESFDDYVKRRELSKMNTKYNRKNGKMFWNSKEQGTYVKAKHELANA